MAAPNGKSARKTPSLHSHPGISPHELRRVAVMAECDPRCVVKYLRKLPQASTMRARIERGLRACDLGHLVSDAAAVGRSTTNGAPKSAPPPSHRN